MVVSLVVIWSETAVGGNPLDNPTAIYIGIALAACAFALVGLVIHRRKLQTHSDADGSDANETLLDSIIERQSPKPGPRRATKPASPHRVPVPRRSGGGEQLSVLEGHLRNAIFDASARDRLVSDAMRATGGDRTAAIRRVLHDLHNEDKRFS